MMKLSWKIPHVGDVHQIVEDDKVLSQLEALSTLGHEVTVEMEK